MRSHGHDQSQDDDQPLLSISAFVPKEATAHPHETTPGPSSAGHRILRYVVPVGLLACLVCGVALRDGQPVAPRPTVRGSLPALTGLSEEEPPKFCTDGVDFEITIKLNNVADPFLIYDENNALQVSWKAKEGLKVTVNVDGYDPVVVTKTQASAPESITVKKTKDKTCISSQKDKIDENCDPIPYHMPQSSYQMKPVGAFPAQKEKAVESVEQTSGSVPFEIVIQDMSFENIYWATNEYPKFEEEVQKALIKKLKTGQYAVEGLRVPDVSVAIVGPQPDAGKEVVTPGKLDVFFKDKKLGGIRMFGKVGTIVSGDYSPCGVQEFLQKQKKLLSFMDFKHKAGPLPAEKSFSVPGKGAYCAQVACRMSNHHYYLDQKAHCYGFACLDVCCKKPDGTLKLPIAYDPELVEASAKGESLFS